LKDGYQAAEPIKGYMTRDDGIKALFEDNNVKIERRGFSGQCERSKVLNFMEDQES
jgi:hypothetical protein